MEPSSGLSPVSAACQSRGGDQAEDADADEQGKKGLLWKCFGTAAEHKAVDGEQED